MTSLAGVACVASLAVAGLAITSNGAYSIGASVIGLALSGLFGTVNAIRMAVALIMIGVATDLDLRVFAEDDEFPPHVVILSIILWSMLFAKARGLV